MTPARVLLVEDDPSIRRLVELALEGLPVDLRLAPTLTEARRQLAEAPVQLLLCDLMLPDGSGADLLREMGAAGAPLKAARRVVFSAGVSGALQAELLAAGVHEVLAKPASVFALVDCVERALQAQAAPSEAPPADAPAAPASPQPDPEADAIHGYFGGDRALFLAYRAQCAPQFARDLAAGQQALQAADWQALRRLAHSLKTVLLTLGHPAESAQAAALEHTAAQAGGSPTSASPAGAAGADATAAADAARALWPPLATTLARLAAAP